MGPLGNGSEQIRATEVKGEQQARNPKRFAKLARTRVSHFSIALPFFLRPFHLKLFYAIFDSLFYLVSCLRNTFHNFRLLSGAGGQPAGLAKMRRRFLHGPSLHLLYGVDGSHLAMYLQVLAPRARVPLRRQGDGWVALRFPPILAAPAVLPPAPR
jgi:hypothetical protein